MPVLEQRAGRSKNSLAAVFRKRLTVVIESGNGHKYLEQQQQAQRAVTATT